MENVLITNLPEDLDAVVALFKDKVMNYKIKYPNFILLNKNDKKRIFVNYLIEVVAGVKFGENGVMLDSEASLSYYRGKEFIQDLQVVMMAAAMAFREKMSYLPDFKVNYLDMAKTIYDKMLITNSFYFINNVVRLIGSTTNKIMYGLIETSAELSLLAYFYSSEEIVDLINNKKITV